LTTTAANAMSPLAAAAEETSERERERKEPLRPRKTEATIPDGSNSISTAVGISLCKDEQPVQPKLDSYPVTNGRHFNYSWFSLYPFIEYSAAIDSVFCFPCRHFATQSTIRPGEHFGNRTFIERGFRKWKDFNSLLKQHVHSSRHKTASLAWQEYTKIKTNSSACVADQLVSSCRAAIAENRHVETLLKVFILCARQGITFWGHDEAHDSSNEGNYIEILELVVSTQPSLFNQLRSRHYTSHHYQNDLVHSAAEVLRESIIEEVRQAKYFSVLVDETKDVSKKEQLGLLLHYHQKGIIQERTLGCFHMENLNAQSASNLIIQELQHLKLDVNYTVAQCYDGASVLSEHLIGVQAQIREQIPHAIYVHCHAHRLNLVIADTCSSITQCQKISTFAQELSSYKRHELFVKAQQELGQRVLELARLCVTHWSCRYNFLQTLHARYGTVMEILETILLQTADGVSVITVKGLLERLKSYSSLLRLLVLERIFKILNSASEELKNKDLKLSSTLELVSSNVTVLKEMRSSESKWKELCDEAENMAKAAAIDLSNAKTTRPQRTNKISSKLAQFFVSSTLANFYYPVLDRILAELDRRFTSNSSLLSASTACNPNSESFLDYNKVKLIADHYTSTGTNCDSLDVEVEAAKMHIAPQKLTSIYEFRNIMNELPRAYQSLLSIIDIVLSLPVSTASNERYFSVLKI
uniref:TTF-type domain-containing protein n=1 Tax=Latimeria chalumnae TaxID=7897 RepID=H3AA53_LATCH